MKIRFEIEPGDHLPTEGCIRLINELYRMDHDCRLLDEEPAVLITRKPADDKFIGFVAAFEVTIDTVRNLGLDILNAVATAEEATVREPGGVVRNVKL